jgi:hypothetical protein
MQGYLGFEQTNLAGVGNCSVVVANTTFLDLAASGDAASRFVIGMQFRCPPGGNASTLRKRVAVASGGAGWQAQFRSTGVIRLLASDGTTAVQIDTAENYRDAAWHWVFFRVSRVLNEARIITRYESVSVSIAALLTMTGAIPFGFGVQTGTFNGPEDCQVNQIIVWEGANADAFTQAIARLFDTQANDPTGQLTTYTRASTVTEIVGYEAGFGVLASTFSGITVGGVGPQLASGYNAAFGHASKLGLDVCSAFTNLVTDSDAFTAGTWAKTNVAASSVDANLFDSPRKIREAQRITATGANGTFEDSIVTLASTRYTQYIYLKSAPGQGNQACRLQQWNITAGVENAGLDITVTEEWQLFSLSAVTAVGQVTTGFRVRVNTNGAILSAWRANFKLGELGPSSFSTGATSAVAAVDARCAGAAGALVKGTRGQVIGLTACRIQDSVAIRSIVDAARAADNVDRRYTYYTAAEVPTGDVYSSAGALASSIAAPAANPALELEVNLRYKASGPIPATGGRRTVLEVNGVQTPGSAVDFAATDLATTLFLGQSKTNTDKLEGLLALVQTWDGPG